MKSKTINVWEQIKKNPPKKYKDFFMQEKKFLKENIAKKSIILDVGCGGGNIIKFLSPSAKKIIGIDNDKDAIKKCKNNLKKLNNVKILLKDAENLNFQDNSFDVVICMGTTFDNLGKTRFKILLEIKRILKEGGIFIFGIYNEDALEERLKIYKKYWKGFINKEEGVVLRKGVISEQFSKEEITKILNKSGFKILKILKGEIFYLIKAKPIK